jgi:hypothetical protein
MASALRVSSSTSAAGSGVPFSGDPSGSSVSMCR